MKKTDFMKQSAKGPKPPKKKPKKSGRKESMEDYMKRRDKETTKK